MFRAGSVRSDERQIHGAFNLCTQFALGFFGGLFQSLMGHRVGSQVNAFGFLEFICQVVNQHFVQIVTAEVGVAVGTEYFKNVVADIENRDIECAAAKVKDRDLFVFLLFQAISQCCRGGFVDDTFNLEPGDLACIFGGLTLRVVKVSRYGDDGLLDRFTEIVLSGLFQVLQNHRRDFRRGIFLAADIDLDQFVRSAGHGIGHDFLFAADFTVPTAHEPFNRIDGVLRVGYLLVFGRLADEPFALVGKADD